MASLREELQAAHAQRKEQLAEISLLRDEEKQRAALDQEASLARLRTEMERVRGDLERSHQLEKEAAQEKVREGHDGGMNRWINRPRWNAVSVSKRMCFFLKKWWIIIISYYPEKSHSKCRNDSRVAPHVSASK